MKIRTLLFLAVLLFTCNFAAQAQEYNSAIGLRLGYPTSVSYKTFLNEKGAIEAFAGFRSFSIGYNWFNIGAMYQVHNPISELDGLSWYYGGGAAVYFWSYKNNFVDAGSSTSFGILGALGLDYKFKDAPINASLDWVPTFFVNGYSNGFAGGYGALSVRYVLK